MESCSHELRPRYRQMGRAPVFNGRFAPSGIDPYASAVSDVYQDLFREGSYTGKGIYEIDAFEAALADKVPDNAMLSHDLFEGLFARTALATDVELFEAFPSHYEAAAARQHRWARGDWQLLPWLLGRGHTGSEPHRAVMIPAIGRWKILDNLRRTLSAPAAFLALLAGWLLPQGAAWLGSCFILATIAIPSLLSFVLGLYPRRRGISVRSHVRGAVTDLKLAATQIALTVTFLAYQTWLMSDAILRTLSRLVITRTQLLEWVTAAQAEDAYTCNLVGMYRRMAGGIVLAVGCLWSRTVWMVRLLGCGGTVHPPMDGGSGCGALGQPASAVHRRRAGFARRCPDAPVDCAPDLEVLRDICVTGRPCAATG